MVFYVYDLKQPLNLYLYSFLIMRQFFLLDFIICVTDLGKVSMKSGMYCPDLVLI